MLKISRSSSHNAIGSKKVRCRNQLTNLRHRDRLWCEPISPLKRLLDKHIHFCQRVSVEEQSAQKIRGNSFRCPCAGVCGSLLVCLLSVTRPPNHMHACHMRSHAIGLLVLKVFWKRPILMKRQIAYMIYEHFRETGEFVKQCKDSQISSMYACRKTTSKTSTFDGIKHFQQQAACLQM